MDKLLEEIASRKLNIANGYLMALEYILLNSYSEKDIQKIRRAFKGMPDSQVELVLKNPDNLIMEIEMSGILIN